MEERRRAEEKFIRDQRDFQNRNQQQYNFASKGDADMYGASYGGNNRAGGNSYGDNNYSGGANYGAQGNNSLTPGVNNYSASNNANYNANMNTAGNSVIISPSHDRPAVVSGGCCCNVM